MRPVRPVGGSTGLIPAPPDDTDRRFVPAAILVRLLERERARWLWNASGDRDDVEDVDDARRWRCMA